MASAKLFNVSLALHRRGIAPCVMMLSISENVTLNYQ